MGGSNPVGGSQPSKPWRPSSSESGNTNTDKTKQTNPSGRSGSAEESPRASIKKPKPKEHSSGGRERRFEPTQSPLGKEVKTPSSGRTQNMDGRQAADGSDRSTESRPDKLPWSQAYYPFMTQPIRPRSKDQDGKSNEVRNRGRGEERGDASDSESTETQADGVEPLKRPLPNRNGGFDAAGNPFNNPAGGGGADNTGAGNNGAVGADGKPIAGGTPAGGGPLTPGPFGQGPGGGNNNAVNNNNGGNNNGGPVDDNGQPLGAGGGVAGGKPVAKPDAKPAGPNMAGGKADPSGMLGVGNYTVNPNDPQKTLTNPSGYSLSGNQVNELTGLQRNIMAEEDKSRAAGQNPETNGNISALKNQQRQIINKGDTKRQQAIQDFEKLREGYEKRIQNGENLSTGDMEKYMHSMTQKKRLQEASDRESTEMMRRLRMNYYNDKKGNLTPGEKADFQQLDQQPDPNKKPFNVESTNLGSYEQNVKRRAELEKSIKDGKANQAMKDEYHQRTLDQYSDVESPILQSKYTDGKKKPPSDEVLRQQVKADALVKGGKTPGQQALDYFEKYENQQIKDPAEKAKAGELIGLAKKAKDLQKDGKDLDDDDNKRFHELAQATMNLGDSRDIRNSDLKGKEFKSNALTGLKTGGSDLSKAKFKDNTYLHDSEFTDPKDPKKTTNLTDTKMNKAELVKVKGVGTNFTRTEMVGANMTDSDFRNSNFENTNLKGASIDDKTKLDGSVFDKVNMDNLNQNRENKKLEPKSNFSGTAIHASSMQDSDLRGASFEDALINQSTLKGSDLSGANMSNTVVTNSDLSKVTMDKDTKLTGAAFANTNLSDSKINGTDISNLDFSGKKSDLSGAKFNGVKGENSNFNQANLKNAKFEGKSNLSGSSFAESDIRGAGFKEAKLDFASFQGAEANSGTSFKDASMVGANLLNSKMGDADFSGTQAMGANLQGADLSTIKMDAGTNFTGAIYDDKTQLPGVDNHNEKARAEFAEKQGLVHVDQIDIMAKAAQARQGALQINNLFHLTNMTQGDYNKTINGIQNSWAAGKGGWALGIGFDSEKGSDAVNDKMKDMMKSTDKLLELSKKGYTKENRHAFDEEYKKLMGYKPGEYTGNIAQGERMAMLNEAKEGKPSRMNAQAKKDYEALGEDSLMKKALDSFKDYKENKEAWVENGAMAVNIGAFMAASALAPVTGGASLAVAPLVAGGASMALKMNSTHGNGQDFTGDELVRQFATDVVVGYATLPLSAVGGGVGKLTEAGLTKGGGYVLTKVGGQTIARFATSSGGKALGSLAVKGISNTVAHGVNGASFSAAHRTIDGVMNKDEDLATAMKAGFDPQNLKNGAIAGVIMGHSIDAVGGISHKGLNLFKKRFASKPAAEGGNTGSTKPNTDKPVSDKPVSDKPVSDKPAKTEPKPSEEMTKAKKEMEELWNQRPDKATEAGGRKLSQAEQMKRQGDEFQKKMSAAQEKYNKASDTHQTQQNKAQFESTLKKLNEATPGTAEGTNAATQALDGLTPGSGDAQKVVDTIIQRGLMSPEELRKRFPNLADHVSDRLAPNKPVQPKTDEGGGKPKPEEGNKPKAPEPEKIPAEIEAKIKDGKIGELTAKELGEIPPKKLAEMSPENLAQIPTETLAQLPPETLAQLPNSTLRRLPPETVQKVLPELVKAAEKAKYPDNVAADVKKATENTNKMIERKNNELRDLEAKKAELLKQEPEARKTYDAMMAKKEQLKRSGGKLSDAEKAEMDKAFEVLCRLGKESSPTVRNKTNGQKEPKWMKVDSELNKAKNDLRDYVSFYKNLETLGNASSGNKISKDKLWWDKMTKDPTEAKTVAEKSLKEHFDKHKDEFGFKTQDEYLKGAQDFATNPPKGAVELTSANNNSKVIYDPASNSIGVYTKMPDGSLVPITYHKLRPFDPVTNPDGWKPGSSPFQQFLNSR